MPNHCSNKLILCGPEEDLKEFMEFAKTDESELDINNFVPMPEEIRNTPTSNKDIDHTEYLKSKYGFISWYDWAFNNWGTKWGAYREEVSDIQNDTVSYFFSTAWAPFNEGVLEAMSEKFPRIHFEMKYAERGMGFWGIMKAKDGIVYTNVDNELVGSPIGDPEHPDYFDFPGLEEDIVELVHTSG